MCCDALVAGGWDPRYGARLCGDLRAIGLADVQADYVASCDIVGSLVSRVLSLMLERLRERMVASSDEIDEAGRLLLDRTNTSSSPTTCVARAAPGCLLTDHRSRGSVLLIDRYSMFRGSARSAGRGGALGRIQKSRPPCRRLSTRLV